MHAVTSFIQISVFEFLYSDAFKSEEWKILVDDHEGKLKELEEKYKVKCEAIQVYFNKYYIIMLCISLVL